MARQINDKGRLRQCYDSWPGIAGPRVIAMALAQMTRLGSWKRRRELSTLSRLKPSMGAEALRTYLSPCNIYVLSTVVPLE